MNIAEVIRHLKEEKKRLDKSIAALEAIWEVQHPGSPLPGRRGRKAMPEHERREVSRRMKEYWANWRRQKARGSPGKAGRGASAGSGKAARARGL
jgi:hypothetical protein